jgi:chromosome segregation ATPase
MTELDVDRKVRQMDNDMQAIYKLLDRISKAQEKHGTALEGLSAQFSGVRGTQARQYNRLDELDAGLAEVRVTLSRLGNRLDELDARFDRLDTTCIGLDGKLDLTLVGLGQD